MSTLAKRLHSKLRWDDNGCLVWTGSKNGPGYGNIYSHSEGRKTKTIMTHRAAWMLVNGPIPEGMQVLHTCDNPPCCNEEHLFLGTAADNMQDKSAKGRALPGPVSKQEWWTAKRRAEHQAALKQTNAAKRAKAAIAAGFPADWKQCPICKKWKAKSDYGNNRARFDGIQAQCKPCKNAQKLDRDRIRTGRKQRKVTRSDKIYF